MRLVLWLVVVSGCLSPHPRSGALRCGPSGSCPSGYHCIEGACWREGDAPAAGDLSVADDLLAPPDEDLSAGDLRAEDLSVEDPSKGADLLAADLAQPPKVQGEACAPGDSCAGGLACVDGRCCDGACAGPCQACNVPGLEGTCSDIAAGNPPAHGSCDAEGASTCGRDGTCDGAGACRLHPSGTECQAASCNLSSNVFTPAFKCNGSGTCVPEAPLDCQPYICADATACYNTCSGNGQCHAPNTCVNSSCGKLDDGRACFTDVQCRNGHCVDGVCCDTACGGQCEACNTPGGGGACKPVNGTPVAPRSACAGAGSTCGGACNGVARASCGYPVSSCRSATCIAGVQTVAASCDGAGACPAAVTNACAPYLCGAGACLSSCAGGADCTAAAYCDNTGHCVAKKADGVSCGGDVQCTSDHCADGVCCNAACSGQCEACNTPGNAGVCKAVSGTPVAPRSACGGAGSTCGGACDGATRASCVYPVSSCRSATCSAGVETLAASCDGAGACPAAVANPCAPYICGAAACLSSCAGGADCTAGNYCDNTSHCAAKKADGGSCGADVQCLNGHCVDGVCCNSTCTGQCEACDLVNSAGTCTAVTGAPHGGRAACANGGSGCGGSCNGSNRTVCSYPSTQCRAQSCAGTTLTLAASCDGAGSCPAATTQSCGDYKCNPGGTACLTTCGSDSDCADPTARFCSGTSCIPKRSGGQACPTGQHECAAGLTCVDGVCCTTGCTNPDTCSAGSQSVYRCDTPNAGVCTLTTSACAAAYTCGATLCNTSCSCTTAPCASSACSSGYYCTGSACAIKVANGQTCSGDAACTSGHCVDGRCCNAACTGQCEACDVSGKLGTCWPVPAGDFPHGGRPACLGDGTAPCGETCNGSSRTSCTDTDGIHCGGPYCAGVYVGNLSCIDGECINETFVACSPYGCNTSTHQCYTSCSSSSQCSSPHPCSGGSCI